MDSRQFFVELDARIAQYDLLCHPFYKSWTAGQLTEEDLREYARDYYHHVAAFPTYLAEFGIRLNDGELRRAVLANMSDEKGGEDVYGDPSASHAELWLDFAEGMGAMRDLRLHQPLPEIKALINFFHQVSSERSPAEALAAYYAYESQVPRIAREKARGLREQYGADKKTCSYFTVHETADIQHSQVWKQQLSREISAHPESAPKALAAAEAAAKALWTALDGIEQRRMANAA
ncbi:MAG TPA: iron-containing redox enzyme family protein [Terriglobales bacterium]|nr:iron-containing redox enzyme family protein [Terriglobales bacterium]